MTTTQTPIEAATDIVQKFYRAGQDDGFAPADMAAAAAEGFRAGQGSIQTVADGRWYTVTQDGAATLCVDRADAEAEARKADRAYPRNGPHRAVQLVEASFEAADIATAAAEGFRAGHESNFSAADMASAAAQGYREGAAEMAKLRGQRMVLCSLLGECRPVIDALMQIPGDDDSDARLNGLAGRITGALNALAEDQVKGGES